MTHPLFSAYPKLEGKLPYIKLGNYPTKTERLSGLEGELGIKNIFIKRDDMCSDLYGGNKVRKLEFLLAEAKEKKARYTISVGYAGSNQTLASAVFAKKLGIKPISMHLPQRNARYVRKNLLYQKLLGAELHHYPNIPSIYIGLGVLSVKCLLKSGRLPFVIPPGASNPKGVIGVCGGIFELFTQIGQGLLPKPDLIYVPLGSCGTVAGLLLGIKALGLDIKIVAVAVAGRIYNNFDEIKRLFDGARKILVGLDPSFPDVKLDEKDVEINYDYLGDGYAKFTKEGMDAVRLVKKSDGIDLEGTYTGKAMACLIGDAKKGILSGKTTLFWNTYNSVDFKEKIRDIDYKTLPKIYHRYFEEDYQPLEIRD